MRPMGRLRQMVFMLLLGGTPSPGQGQSDSEALPLFAEDTPLELTLEGPFRTLSRERREREELDGLVRIPEAGGEAAQLDVELRTRGNSRLDICTYPPLRLDFPRRATTGTIFAGQNRLKLVTLCKDTRDYREYLALEYLAYRMLNVLTDASYRVRWVEIDYVDTDSSRKQRDHRAGFLIEDDAELASRQGMEVWEVDRLAVTDLEPAKAALVSVFEFMIGNADWAGTAGPPGERCCHNADLLRDREGRAILVPYDFDQSGLVDAEFAVPPPDLGLRSVRQRIYRGYCANNGALAATFEQFDAARPRIEALIADTDVRARTRSRVSRYIADFYAIINDPDAREDDIVGRCRS